jgi:hypothetical protein
MLQAQFIATALNSQYIAGYASEQVTVPTYIDPDGCATVTELLAAINSQWSGLTTAQRIELKSVLDRLNQDQPNQLQCGMN